jgi:sugar lactone lactonase YvrE
MTFVWAAAAVWVSTFGSTVRAEDAAVEVFLHGDKMQGIHGIVAGPDGQLYVGSVVGQSIYRVDPKSGAASVWQGPPLGMADDLVFAPDGRLVWTSILLGKLHARLGDGPVQELATGLPGMNALAFTKDGRLFATQVFLGDALHEFDPAGRKPPREIMKDMGGLNGFEFGPDGLLYGPLWFKRQVVKVDVATAAISVVAEGFATPAAANFGPDGLLYVLDSRRGEVVRVDTATGQKSVLTTLRSGLDNLCFDAQGRMYVTGMAEAAVFEVDTHTGKSRTIRESPIVAPTDLAIAGDTLYIADSFALRSVDLKTREVKTILRAPELEYAFGIDVSERFIHTASWFNAAVQTFDRKTGALLHTYHKVPLAYDVLEADDGSLLVLQMSPGTISRLSAEEGKAPEVIATGLDGGTALARAGADAAYVTLFDRGEVVRVDLKTGGVTPVATGLQQPEGIAVANDGRILVVEANAGRVIAIDPKSGDKTSVATGLSLALPAIPGFPPMGNTSGVAVGPDGSIFVGSEKDSAIFRLNKR